jgi:hypothetical protein
MDTQCWPHRTVRGDVCKGLLAGCVAWWAMNPWLAMWQRMVE